MEYKSKHKAEKIDALLDKVEALPEGGNGGGSEDGKIYTFHLQSTTSLITEELIDQMEAQNQDGMFDNVIALAISMLQENEEILAKLKEKSIPVMLEMGTLQSAIMQAMGYGNQGASCVTWPTTTEYIKSGADVSIKILNMPVKDGRLLETNIGKIRLVFERKEVSDGTHNDSIIRLDDKNFLWVPEPDKAIESNSKTLNIECLKYWDYFEPFQYAVNQNYTATNVISMKQSGSIYQAIYILNKKLYQSEINAETGDATTIILADYTNS